MPPLPNSRAIPPGLADRLAPAVGRGMTAHVRIRHPGQVQQRDDTTGRTSFTPAAPFYDGPARVQGHGGQAPTVADSDRRVASGGYLVAVPHTVTGVRPYDLVEVVSDVQDPALAGLLLVVDDIPAASIVLQRSLTCSVHAGAAAGT